MRLGERIIDDGISQGDVVDVDTELAANLAYFACTVWTLRFWSIGNRSAADVRDRLTTRIVGGL